MFNNKKVYDFTGQFAPYEDSVEGSSEWAIRLSGRFQVSVNQADKQGVYAIMADLEYILKSQPWMIFPPENPYMNIHEWFINVCGHTWPDIKLLINTFRPEIDLAKYDELVDNQDVNIKHNKAKYQTQDKGCLR